MALVDLATCLLKDLSKRLLTDCSSECPDESNKEIIEDFRLTESLLSQFFMIRACAEAEGKDPDYSKITLALTNLIEKYQCLGCQTYAGESIPPDGPEPEDCDIVFEGTCSSLNIIPGDNVVSISYDNGSGDTGIPCPLATNGNIGNQIGNLLNTKYLCITDDPITAPDKCGYEVNSNTLVYVYYDGTSMGETKVEEAYEGIMDWLHQQPSFTPVTATPSSFTTGTLPNTINTGENVFHSIMAGERWLDWGMQPITGAFNNDNVPESQCSFITQGDQLKGADRITCGNLPVAVSNWAYDTASVTLPISGVTQTVHQFYDTTTGSFRGEDVADHSGGVPPMGNCGDPCDPTGTPCGNPFIANAAGLNVWMGPPPASPTANDVLIIVFADEAECVYHGGSRDPSGLPNPVFSQSFTSGLGSTCNCDVASYGFDVISTPETVTSPTGMFKKDYDKYVSEYDARQATPGAGTYKAFIYPTCPGLMSINVMPYPLNITAAIDSGDDTITPDGLFSYANVPSTSIYQIYNDCNAGYYSFDTSADNTTGKFQLVRGINNNDYHDVGYGGLDQKGWGYNPTMLAFNNTTFETDLEEFLSEGTGECDGKACIVLKIYEADNPAEPVTDEIVNINGVSYTTDAVTGIVEVGDFDSGVVTIGYANSECYELPVVGDCTQYTVTAYKDTETYDTCVSFSDVQCGCGPEGGRSADIEINVGLTSPQVVDGLIGTITNETTGVVTDITPSMVSGPDGDGNYIVTVPFENTPNDDIPDGRYTILLYGIGDPFVEYKECRLILCESATIIQDLFKKFVSNKECCPCEKPFEDFIQAYALFRALKVVGVNDCEYETFIDENITKLQALLVTAKAGNCKDC